MWTVCNMLLKAACSDWIVGAMTHLIDRTNHDRQVRDFDKKCRSLSPSIANYSLFASRMKELLSFCTMAQFTYNSLNSTGINPSNYDVTRTATDSKKKAIITGMHKSSLSHQLELYHLSSIGFSGFLGVTCESRG